MSDKETDVYEDPHQSKIDPDDPRLRISKPRGRSLKKGPVIIIALTLVFLTMVAFVVALLPSAMRAKTQSVEEEPVVAQGGNTMPEFIREAPDNSDPVSLPVSAAAKAPPTPDYVPKLGEPLPGDLGAAMVDPAQKPVSVQLQGKRERQQASFGERVHSGMPKQPSLAEKELLKARQASLFFAGGPGPSDSERIEAQTNTATDKIIDAYKATLDGVAGGGDGGAGVGMPDNPFGGDGDQNKQKEKNAFLKGGGSRDRDYVASNMALPRSPYEVKAGTIIPVSLVTGINSDLPGEIIGRVRENVYDTVSGNHLLVPQGSTLMAAYDSMITYGQSRVLVCWNRLLRPDGSSISMECMPGVDLDGNAGFSGKVNNHYGRLLAGVLVSSVLSVGATKSQGSGLGDDMTVDKMFAANVGGHINDVGQQITSKNLEIQPTIEVPPGDSVNVLVNKDMIIPPYKAP